MVFMVRLFFEMVFVLCYGLYSDCKVVVLFFLCVMLCVKLFGKVVK